MKFNSITKEQLEKLMKANECNECIIGTIYDSAKAMITKNNYGSVKYKETIVSVSFEPYDEDDDYYGWFNNDGSPISPDEARAMAQKEYVLYTHPKYAGKWRSPNMYGNSENFSTMDELWSALQAYDFDTVKNPPEVTDFIN
jgi:hypothetical protein